jgi:hypothetical protein
MGLFALLLPFLLVLGVVGVSIKLAAWMRQRSRVTWGHILVLLGLWLLTAITTNVISALAEQAQAPALAYWIIGLVGMAAYLTLGGWFLGTRGLRVSGEVLGWADGLKIMLLAWLLLAGAALVGFALVALLTFVGALDTPDPYLTWRANANVTPIRSEALGGVTAPLAAPPRQ